MNNKITLKGKKRTNPSILRNSLFTICSTTKGKKNYVQILNLLVGFSQLYVRNSESTYVLED